MNRVSSPAEVAVKALFLGYLGWIAWRFLMGETFVFVDNFNLAIHEAGHVLLIWGGKTLSIWGGTLLQMAVPLACLGYFGLGRREPYSAGMCGWWVGENLVNVGIYMADAEKQWLPMVGGGEHDWAYLLGRAGLLPLAEILGGGVRVLGLMVMATAVGWMGLVVRRQLRSA